MNFLSIIRIRGTGSRSSSYKHGLHRQILHNWVFQCSRYVHAGDISNKSEVIKDKCFSVFCDYISDMTVPIYYNMVL